MTVEAPQLDVAPHHRTNRLHQAGWWALMALALALPFEVSQHPLRVTRFDTFTNLKVVVWAVVALAVVSLAPHVLSFLAGLGSGSWEPASYIYRRRVALGLFIALVLSCGVSSLLSGEVGNAMRWTLSIVLGGLIWLAVPLWVSENRERRVRRVCVAIVAGAAIAAGVGVCEVVVGPPLADHLLWFKAQPTTMGPYLRLSGTFQYANLAGFYFELILPLAVLGLMQALFVPRRRWAACAAWLVAADVLLCALLLTYSRGALLGLALGAIMAALAPPGRWLLALIRQKRWWLAGIGANLALVAGLAFLASPSSVILRWTSESDQDWYRAAYASALPATIRTGGHLRVPVEVTNLGPLTWSTEGAHPIHLSYHWLYASGQVALFEGIRSSLAADVPPGHSATVLAVVQAPGSAGRYFLVWDMVQEGVTWFSVKSATYTKQPVQVVGPTVAIDAGRESSAPQQLPQALAAPGRQQLWAAAIRVVEAHPLLGVGPDGFRLSYGAYLRPKQKNWDMRILANSLPLEIFADLGLLGGGLFFALFAAMVWTLIVGLWHGRVLVWWQVALIASFAAYLGHGLVDYVLNSNSTLYLFWLLCGLASAADGGETYRRAQSPV